MNEQSKYIGNALRAGRKSHYHVEPRYSSGSPALVNLGEAEHIAATEEEFHAIALSGIWGDQVKKRAQKEGLGGIVYARWEKGRKVFRLDLITGQQSEEPPRLSHKEQERMANLRNRRQYAGLRTEEDQELSELERRSKLHRQES